MGKIILNDIEYGIGVSNGSNVDTTNLVEKDSIVTVIDENVTDEQIPSALATKTYVDNKTISVDTTNLVEKDSIVTTIDDTCTDEQVPSALATKTYVDNKVMDIDTTNLVEKDSIVTVIDDTCTDEQVPSAKAVYDKLSDLPVDSNVTKDTLSLVTNSQFFTISITKNNANWYGNLKFSYVYGTTTPTEVDITITDTLSYTVSKGTNTINKITYTVDGANLTIGINCTATMYGTQTVEMPSEFGTINSLTAEEFTGANTATLNVSTTKDTYVTLAELGLTAPITVGEIFNAMPNNTMAILACDDITNHITDVPMSFGVLTIKKNGNGRFSIDYQNSLASSPCNVKKWIGTLKGVDGTGLYWKEVAYKDNIAIYRSLSELGVDTTATLKDITRAMVNNSIIAIKVDAMADQSEYNSITQGTVTIYKIEDARIQAIMTEKSTGRIWVGILGGENTIIGWKEIGTDDKSKATLVANTATLKLDVTKKNASWFGAYKISYMYAGSLCEMEIATRGTNDVNWSIITGKSYVNKVTYTQNGANYVFGIEFTGTVYGIQQVEVIGDFADINSLTKDAFTGTNTATRWYADGKTNGVTLLDDVAELGLTSPCTTVQIVQAMRSKANVAPASAVKGIFNNENKTISDAPTSYGLLEVSAYGNDRLMIRYDGIGSSTYSGSWIGNIKGSNGTFSSITWDKIATGTITGGDSNSIVIDDVTKLGLTYPCSTADIANAMRAITSVEPFTAIKGIFGNDDQDITDAPSNYGVLEISCHGKGRFMINYQTSSGVIGGNSGDIYMGEIIYDRDTYLATGTYYIGINWYQMLTLSDENAYVNGLYNPTSQSTVAIWNDSSNTKQNIIRITKNLSVGNMTTTEQTIRLYDYSKQLINVYGTITISGVTYSLPFTKFSNNTVQSYGYFTNDESTGVVNLVINPGGVKPSKGCIVIECIKK